MNLFPSEILLSYMVCSYKKNCLITQEKIVMNENVYLEAHTQKNVLKREEKNIHVIFMVGHLVVLVTDWFQ